MSLMFDGRVKLFVIHGAIRSHHSSPDAGDLMAPERYTQWGALRGHRNSVRMSRNIPHFSATSLNCILRDLFS